MRSLALVVLVLGLGLAGCSSNADDTASANEEVKTAYAAPGKDLGRTTHLVADLDGSATFSVYDRALERRLADGKVESLGKVDAGYECLVVSKKYAALVTSALVNNTSKTTVRIFGRDGGWKELR